MSFNFNVPTSLQKNESDADNTKGGESKLPPFGSRPFNSLFGKSATTRPERTAVKYDDLDTPGQSQSDKVEPPVPKGRGVTFGVGAGLGDFLKKPSNIFGGGANGNPFSTGAGPNRFKLNRKEEVPPPDAAPRQGSPSRPTVFQRMTGTQAAAPLARRSSPDAKPHRGTFAPSRLNTDAPVASNAMKWTRKAEDTLRARSSSPSVADVEKTDPPGMAIRDNKLFAQRLMPASSASKDWPKDQAQKPILTSLKDRQRAQVQIQHLQALNSTRTSLTRDQTTILESILALIGKHCPGDMDRYNLLDERDKLLCKWRAEEEKLNSIRRGKGEVVDGECTAMCSERERYVREVQKRISPFECDSHGRMDTARLVKEYARSAADQEKPLPHELRSKEFLQNSMTYLLTEILDKMPRNRDDCAGWYDFLWSRTRAIRKELTQLMLSDDVAVALVERCTRLHIACGYLLCSLEVEKFDQKMNTENLGKCLQTLRHLYEDLERRGISCESESEFRAYDVMLHLHDSNVLRQVLAYRKEVRESRPVRLAIQLASAMQNKNYVRFFRILKNEGSFLQCCICHRFFDQVRADALNVMTTAVPRQSPFPVDKVVTILSFDDREQAITALGHHEIAVIDDDSDSFMFCRESFNPVARAPMIPCSWIDSKSTVKLSQIIFGPGIIPSLATSVLVNSFDESDCYTQDPVLQPIISKYGSATRRGGLRLEPLPAPSVPQPVPPAASRASLFAPPATSIFGQARFGRTIGQEPTAHAPQPGSLPAFAPSIFAKPAPAIPVTAPVDPRVEKAARKALIDEQCMALLKSVADSVIRNVAADVHAEEQNKAAAEERLAQIQREEEAALARADSMAETLELEVVEEMLKEAAKAELREANFQHLHESAEWIAERLWETKFLPAVDKQLKSLLRKILKDDKKEMDEGLARFRGNMSTLWLRQFWDTWRAKISARKTYRETRKRALDDFTPQWSSTYFNVDAYVGPPTKSPRTSFGSCLVTVDVVKSMRIAALRSRRSSRILRCAFEHWRSTARKRVVERTLTQMAIRSAAQWSKALVDRCDIDNNAISRSDGSTTRQTLRRRPSISDTPEPRKKASRRSFGFLHPDDSFFDVHSPRQGNSSIASSAVRGRRHFSNVLNSTPMTWHTDVEFNFTRQADFDNDAKMDYDEKDFTILPHGSVLTEKDMAIAREALEHSQLSMPDFRQYQPVATVPEGPSTEDLTLMAREKDRLNVSISELERSATDLQRSMDEHREKLARLIAKF